MPGGDRAILHDTGHGVPEILAEDFYTQREDDLWWNKEVQVVNQALVYVFFLWVCAVAGDSASDPRDIKSFGTFCRYAPFSSFLNGDAADRVEPGAEGRIRCDPERRP